MASGGNGSKVDKPKHPALQKLAKGSMVREPLHEAMRHTLLYRNSVVPVPSCSSVPRKVLITKCTGKEGFRWGWCVLLEFGAGGTLAPDGRIANG